MRKTFCARGTNSDHNGVFNTETPLSIGTVVKLKPHDPHTVVQFSPDPVITSVQQYNNARFIDIISTSNDTYILGATSDTYFIRHLYIKKDISTFSLWSPERAQAIQDIDSTEILLGVFQPPLSLIGNICIQNRHIVVLIYHKGQFTVTCNRSSFSIKHGVLFSISLDNFKIVSFRNIPLTPNFLLFGGLEEDHREEFLYLINDNNLHRFNPSGSHSWTISVIDNIVSACTAPGIVILLRTNSIEAIKNIDGQSLWTITMTESLRCCISYDSHIYITSTNNNITTVIQGIITDSRLMIISYNTITNIMPSKLCCISTLGIDRYIIWTENDIQIYTNDNRHLSTIILKNISISKIYRLLPRHSSVKLKFPIIGSGSTIATNPVESQESLNIPIIVNGNNPILINDIDTFSGSESYAGLFYVKDDFPQRAGIVTDIIGDTRVYVVLDGPIIDVIKDLILHRTYIIDMQGNLTGSYHDMNKSRPFLITGNESNTAFIIYNGLA